jgi:hypothetical protein
VKQQQGALPRSIQVLLGFLLLLVGGQFVFLARWVHQGGHRIFHLIGLLSVLVFVGFLWIGFKERSRFAWMTAQLMLMVLFLFSLIGFGVSLASSLRTGSLLLHLLFELLAALINGVLLNFIFSLPVRDYFSTINRE